jgi:hypothetical protein
MISVSWIRIWNKIKLNLLTFCCFSKNQSTSKGQSSKNLVKFYLHIWICLGMNKNLWTFSEPGAAVHHQARAYPYMSKTDLKSRRTVPDTITWLPIIQQCHESASAQRFFSWIRISIKNLCKTLKTWGYNWPLKLLAGLFKCLQCTIHTFQ